MAGGDQGGGAVPEAIAECLDPLRAYPLRDAVVHLELLSAAQISAEAFRVSRSVTIPAGSMVSLAIAPAKESHA